jgi:hypothetical protein
MGVGRGRGTPHTLNSASGRSALRRRRGALATAFGRPPAPSPRISTCLSHS